MHSFSVISVNIAINRILLKTRFFGLGLHFSIFNHFDAVDPKAAEFCRITQNNGQYVVEGHQGHQFWCHLKLVSDFLLVNNTTLRSISHHFQITCSTVVLIAQSCYSVIGDKPNGEI